MEQNIRTIKLKVEVTAREKDGRSFNVFNTYSKNGRKTELKFRKEVKNTPEKKCYIIVDVDKVSVNTSGEYPVVWVHEILEILDMEEANAEYNRKKVLDYFGDGSEEE